MEGGAPRVSGRVYVETPEQIDFAFETAGIGPRMLAYLIDLSIRAAAILVLALVIVIATGGAPFGLGVLAVLAFFLEWGYHTLLEWWFDGVTPGKKALRLRVVRTNGVSVDLYRSAMRNLLRAADGFPPMAAFFEFFPFPSYAIGAFIIFLTASGRRIGDLAADTMVVVEERSRIRDLPALPNNPVSLGIGTVTQARITTRDLAMIDAFFRRRAFLSPERAEEIAGILALPLAQRMGVDSKDPQALLAGVLLAGRSERESLTGIEQHLGGVR